MDNKDYTIPKNIILNWLYSTDRHVSVAKLARFLEQHTNGSYKLVSSSNPPYSNINDIQGAA